MFIHHKSINSHAHVTSVVERSNETPTTESSNLVALKGYFDRKFNVLETKITNDAQAVSTELDEKFKS